MREFFIHVAKRKNGGEVKKGGLRDAIREEEEGTFNFFPCSFAIDESDDMLRRGRQILCHNFFYQFPPTENNIQKGVCTGISNPSLPLARRCDDREK